MTFAQELDARLARLYPDTSEGVLQRVGELVGRSSRTVRYWLEGQVVPDEIVQQHVLSILDRQTTEEA